jgi:hypothetical protein
MMTCLWLDLGARCTTRVAFDMRSLMEVMGVDVALEYIRLSQPQFAVESLPRSAP